MKKNLLQPNLTLLLLLIAFPAGAQQVHAPPDTLKVKYTLEPIVVTATKVSHAQRELAASISLLDRDDLETAPTTSVLEVIEHRVPGLHVTEWGPMGFGAAGSAAGKISMRGIGGAANTHVLILRNGRPDFMGLMGCTIADEFSSDGVERVEIIRGPGSFLYGTNATGGIINIIPRTMRREGFETRISSGYGTFDTRKLSASHGGRIGALDYYLTASHRQSDGHREGSDYRGRHFTGHVGYSLNDRTSLEFNSNLADIRVLDPGPRSNPATDNWYDLLRYGGDLNVIHESPLGETNLKLHGNFGRHDFYDGWESRDRTVGVMIYQNTSAWEGNTSTLGFDYKRYGGRAIDASTDYGEFSILEYAPYIHVQQMISNSYILSAGLRVEHHSLYGHEVLPKIGLVAYLSRSTVARFSAAKGFRSPSLRELYFWAPANDSLTPDRLMNYEIGLTHNTGHNVRLDAVLFRSEGKNLIQFSAPPPMWVNSGSYTHNGVEIVVDWLPTEKISLGGSWSWIDLSGGVFNTPGRKFTAYARYATPRLTCHCDLLVIGDLTGADFPGPSPAPVLHPMEDYAVVDLVALLPLADALELTISLKNALNSSYQSMYGYPMPGRHLVMDIGYLLR